MFSLSMARKRYKKTMPVVVKLRLKPTSEQRRALMAMIHRCNEACSWLAAQAFASKCEDAQELQTRHYDTLRERFQLPSQAALLVIDKATGAYKRDPSKLPVFRPDGSIAFDPRCYTLKSGSVSLRLLDARQEMPFVTYDWAKQYLDAGVWKQADLSVRKGQFYLTITIEIRKPTLTTPQAFLGVDLGIVNLATDSDRGTYSGDKIEAVRTRLLNLRRVLQPVKTRSSRKHLCKIGRKEARFRRDTNHKIAHRLVAKAKDTTRGIALEDLTGIRDRVTVTKQQRARQGGWSYAQLREFVTYKAVMAGVVVALVDPRNTSRTCPMCDHCEKANRISREEFVCKSCGFSAPADFVAAVNIARRAEAQRPIVPAHDVGTRRQPSVNLTRRGTSSGIHAAVC